MVSDLDWNNSLLHFNWIHSFVICTCSTFNRNAAGAISCCIRLHVEKVFRKERWIGEKVTDVNKVTVEVGYRQAIIACRAAKSSYQFVYNIIYLIMQQKINIPKDWISNQHKCILFQPTNREIVLPFTYRLFSSFSKVLLAYGLLTQFHFPMIDQS